MKGKQLLVTFFLSALAAFGAIALMKGNRTIVSRSLGGGESLDLGVEDFKQAEYEEAIAHFNDAIEVNPKYIDAYIYRGLTYEQLGNFELAIADHSQAIELNPKESLIYFHRGMAYHLSGSGEKAIADYNKAISLDANYADAYMSLGLIYQMRGNRALAIDNFQKAADLYEEQGYLTGSQKAKQLIQQLQQ